VDDEREVVRRPVRVARPDPRLPALHVEAERLEQRGEDAVDLEAVAAAAAAQDPRRRVLDREGHDLAEVDRQFLVGHARDVRAVQREQPGRGRRRRGGQPDPAQHGVDVQGHGRA
jgi:hypothetical protein